MSMIDATQMEALCQAIGLDRRRLAQLTGLHPNTIRNVLEGRNSLTDTVSAISRVIIEEELRLRDHCLSRHPLETAKEAAE